MMSKKLKFCRSPIESAIRDAQSLLEQNWDSSAHYENISYKPDVEFYKRAEMAGIVRVFVIRNQSEELVALAVFFLLDNPHSQNSRQANCDVFAMAKTARSAEGRFTKWIDEKLQADGVQVVYQGINRAHRRGPRLEKLGYEKVDTVYCRRLGSSERLKTAHKTLTKPQLQVVEVSDAEI